MQSFGTRVRVSAPPPNQYNPNLYPIGDEFVFIVYIAEIEDPNFYKNCLLVADPEFHFE